MTFEKKLARINQQRLNLRAGLIKKMRTSPTMEDSETLRLVENDISFWEKQTDYSVTGLVTTLGDSLKLNRNPVES